MMFYKYIRILFLWNNLVRVPRHSGEGHRKFFLFPYCPFHVHLQSIFFSKWIKTLPHACFSKNFFYFILFVCNVTFTATASPSTIRNHYKGHLIKQTYEIVWLTVSQKARTNYHVIFLNSFTHSSFEIWPFLGHLGYLSSVSMGVPEGSVILYCSLQCILSLSNIFQSIFILKSPQFISVWSFQNWCKCKCLVFLSYSYLGIIGEFRLENRRRSLV